MQRLAWTLIFFVLLFGGITLAGYVGVPQPHAAPAGIAAAVVLYGIALFGWTWYQASRFGPSVGRRLATMLVLPQLAFTAALGGAIVVLHYMNAPSWAYALVAVGAIMGSRMLRGREEARS